VSFHNTGTENVIYKSITCIQYVVLTSFHFLTPSVQCEFCAIIKPVLDVFWVVVTQQLDSKLSNSFSTCLIDHKLSGKMHFHRKNICLKFGCKRSSMRTVTVFYA